MATFGSVNVRTFEMDADVSSNLYEIARVTDGGQRVNVASEAISSEMVGVFWNIPGNNVGDHVSVAYEGRGKVRAGAAINSTAVYLTTNGSGRAIAAGSGDMVFGRAFETANADGDIIEVQLDQPFRLSGAV